MTLTEGLILLSLALFSYADLRYRLVPGIEIFLLGAVLLAFPSTPLRTSIVLLACAWGMFRPAPKIVGLAFLLYPPAWPALLTGYGFRNGRTGKADLLAISSIACLLPFPAVLISLLGLEVWRRLWICRWKGNVPALPGLFLGVLLYSGWKMLW